MYVHILGGGLSSATFFGSVTYPLVTWNPAEVVVVEAHKRCIYMYFDITEREMDRLYNDAF